MAATSFTALLAWLSPHQARAADADTTASGFAGLYSSSADPDGYILIHRMVGEGQYQIHAGQRFISMGYVENDEYSGVLRRRPRATAAAHIGWLRFRREGNAITAQWSEELGAAATHTETWSLVSRFRRRTDADSIPPLSEPASVDSMPVPTETTRPIYPPLAQRRGIEGSIVLQVRVTTDGRVKDVFVLKSIPELDDAAVAAVKQWRFRPAIARGKPTDCWLTMPVKFKLR